MRVKTGHCCTTLQITCHRFELRFPDSTYIHAYQVSWLTSEHFATFVNPEEVVITEYYVQCIILPNFLAQHSLPWV